MNSIRLAWKNANGNRFRSWTVVVCAALMAGFIVAATIIIGGAQKSLNLALERLGADIVVVPAGSEHLMENAFLMGVPAASWMPKEYVQQIAEAPGVEVASPQFFLSTLRGATCCSLPEMFMIAYDPRTDFTLRPWLEKNLDEGLHLGQAVGGAFVYVPSGQEKILIYGYEVDLVGNLEQTGTGLDQSMFITFETAREIARLSTIQAEAELKIPADSVSAVMIKLQPGSNPERIARQIQEMIPQVKPVVSTNLFHSQRLQILELLQSVVVLLIVAWSLAIASIGLVFSMAINERRQEIGVLRALGSTQRFVLKALLAEGLILALGGGIAGICLSTFTIFLFRRLIIQTMGVPFLFPSPFSLIVLAAGALGLTLLSVVLGALIPTTRTSRMEPALAMRK